MEKSDFNLKKLQEVQLVILMEFDRICKEHNLPYQLFSGTLLGAVRHKAFVPWDDDIDVAMLRKDYTMFLKVCKGELDSQYFLQTHETDKGYIHSFARIRKNNTLLLQKYWLEIDMHHGIFIDVFPLDKVLPDRLIGYVQYHLLYSFRRLKALKTRRACLLTKNILKRQVKLLGYHLLKPFSYQWMNQLETRILCMFEKGDSKYSTCLSEGEKEVYAKYMIKNDDFYDTIEREFEGQKFPIPRNYDAVLRNNFGDYMSLPPLEEQKPHHGILELDFDTSQGKIEKEETELDESDIIKLFSEITDDQYPIKGEIQRLGGMNNNNYKIETMVKDFVFRLPGKGSNESVNRDSEQFNAKTAYAIGLDCKTIYFDNETGLKITEYIEEAQTLTIASGKEEDNMALMAGALNQLHQSKKKLYEDFRPFDEIKDYQKIIIKKDQSLLDNFQDLGVTISFLRDQVEKLESAYVPCHLDAWPENFVKGKDQIYLIDWEYSSNYDRHWDVVSIALECDYSKAEEELFYHKYFGRKPSNEERLKMDVLRILMDVYWSMWSLAKVSCGEKDLYDYSIDRYKRALANLNTFKKEA